MKNDAFPKPTVTKRNTFLATRHSQKNYETSDFPIENHISSGFPSDTFDSRRVNHGENACGARNQLFLVVSRPNLRFIPLRKPGSPSRWADGP